MFDSLRAVWQISHGSRARYALAILSMVISACLLFLVPMVPRAVIDGVLSPTDTTDALITTPLNLLGGRAYVAQNLWVPGVAIVLLTGLASVASYFRGRWAAAASESAIRRLRDAVYDHLQRLPVSYFDEAKTGDLIQRCTSDVETVRVFLATHVVEIGRALIMFFVPLPLMLTIDVRMTGVAVLLLPVIVGFSTLFFLKVRDRFLEADEAEGELTTSVQENLTGIRVVKAFGRADYERARFATHNATYRNLDYRLYQLLAVFWSVSDLLTFLQQVLVVGAGIYWITTGELTIGAFFYFLTAVGMFMYPLRSMGRILADLGKASVALGRVNHILTTLQEHPVVEPVDLPDVQGELALHGVTFRYNPEDAPALEDITLRIAPRSTVAFVGPSGSGKSTLIALLLRLYDPTEGEVRLDGVDVRTLDLQALRRQLAVVMQQPFLYSKSLVNNLKVGRINATQAEVERATQIADVHATIQKFDQGYDTAVGERGVTLSGGQRQRVALARALLQQPPVLILDDSLSAVDTATESAILDRLRNQRGRQTTILVAHRLSTVRLADQIFVLDQGRIVQEGDHATLSKTPGPYRDLWRLQTESASLQTRPPRLRQPQEA